MLQEYTNLFFVDKIVLIVMVPIMINKRCVSFKIQGLKQLLLLHQPNKFFSLNVYMSHNNL